MEQIIKLYRSKEHIHIQEIFLKKFIRELRKEKLEEYQLLNFYVRINKYSVIGYFKYFILENNKIKKQMKSYHIDNKELLRILSKRFNLKLDLKALNG